MLAVPVWLVPPGVNTAVYGAVPPACGVNTSLPLLAPAQVVAVGINVTVNPVPAGTVVETGVEVTHPLASVTVMLCGPAATPVNRIVLVALVWVTTPSIMAVKGAPPLVICNEILPLLIPEQLVPVAVGTATNPAPAVTVILFIGCWHPLASVITAL